MKIGVFSTFMSPHATPDAVASVAQSVEQAGLESLWMGEHVVLFDEMEFPYPASADGRIPVPEGGGLLDTVATFGYVANATSTLRLGTGITLISQRHPVYTAKEFATLDWLSSGRIDFGIGVGWCKEEVITSAFPGKTAAPVRMNSWMLRLVYGLRNLPAMPVNILICLIRVG